jgi:hypothetical protein
MSALSLRCAAIVGALLALWLIPAVSPAHVQAPLRCSMGFGGIFGPRQPRGARWYGR